MESLGTLPKLMIDVMDDLWLNLKRRPRSPHRNAGNDKRRFYTREAKMPSI